MEYETIIPLSETEIEQIIPHRRPFRFIDSIVSVEFGKSATAMLNDLTKPEYEWLKAHFPSYAVVPGAIIIEALAEVGAVAVLSLEQNRNKIALLAGVDKTRFRREIRPGDPVRLQTEITHLRTNFGRGYGRAFLEDDTIAAEGIISFALTDKPLNF